MNWSMLKNAFKISWRNLLRDRQFTFLNLLGLSTGLACTFLIYLWVADEKSVDTFNQDDQRLYQVIKTAPNSDGTISTFSSTQGRLAESMAKQLPEVEYAVAVRPQDLGILSIGDKYVKARSQFVDKDFFKIFSYQVIEGNRDNVLADKYGIILSDQLALKIFNTTSGLIGKTMFWNRGEFTGSYKVAGVFKAPPANATEQFDLLFTYEVYDSKEGEDLSFWGSNGVYTFITLKPGTDVGQFSKKIKDFTKDKIRSLYKDDGLLKWEGDVMIQRFSDRYLYNRYDNGVQAGGRIEYVKLFSIIAIFILVIACINFMNLSTARAAGRMKEVGIKKVVGASRSSLILQYMGESMLMSFLSLAMAILLVQLLLPAFKQITGKELVLTLNFHLALVVIGITIITGLIAGSYPALYLSGFKPVLVLKGKFSTSAGENWVRKGLVVFQFSISIVLIVSVLVVYRQMKLIQNTNLGFNKTNIIHFTDEGKLKNSRDAFLTAAKNIPGVINASAADGDLFGRAGHGGGGIDWEGKDPNLGIEYYGIGVDYDFIELMGLKMAEGRAFSRAYGSDSSKVIFNEAAIAAMHIKDPIGKTVSLWGKKKQIIGIAKDYHFESLYKKVGPAFFTCTADNGDGVNLLVKIKAGNEKNTLANIESLYKTYNQGLAFDYKFMDEDYQALYASEQRVAVLSRYFAVIAILISCLGLFGLAAFTAQKRRKEIGIRKVIGASVNNLALMLSGDFIKLVLVALLIAFPLAWWALNQWLQNFAYRVNIGADVFVLSAIAILLITLLTISYQAIKSALMNPVSSLRTE